MPAPLLLSLSLILFIAAIGDKIKYEQPISVNKYLWMVSLRLKDNSSEIQLCGGSLIGLSPSIILTAAHCFDFLSFNTIDGTIRDSDDQIVQLYADFNKTYWNINTANDYTLPLSACNIHIHPKWQTGQYQFGYDIALIIFDYFATSAHHQTLLPKLLGSNDYDDDDDDDDDDDYTHCCLPNEQLMSIGYDKNSDELRSTNLNYICKLECSATAVVNQVLRRFNAHENIVEVLEEHEQGLNVHVKSTGFYDGRIICVSGNNTTNIATYQSVSGGPLFRITNQGITEIIGIISFNYNDGNCNTHIQCPSFCTNVTSYYNWIQTTINFELSKQKRNAAFTDDNQINDNVLIIIEILILILIGALLLVCGCLVFLFMHMHQQQFVQPFIQILIEPKYNINI